MRYELTVAIDTDLPLRRLTFETNEVLAAALIDALFEQRPGGVVVVNGMSLASDSTHRTKVVYTVGEGSR